MWHDEIWDQVERAMARLEEAWRSTGDADLSAFVPPPEAPSRNAVLVTLIKIDLEHRYRSRMPRRVEDYLENWPELSGDADTVVDLISAECRVRGDNQDPPTREELAARFPALADRVDIDARSNGDNPSDLAEPSSRESTSLFDSIVADQPEPHLADDSPTLSPDSLLVNRYRVLRALGHGGMGTVYLAKDEELDRSVAVKLLHRWVSDEVGGDLLRDEARKAAQPKHPIVPIHDVVALDDGEYFLVMEYVEGESLAEILVARALDTARAADIAIQLADALHAAHEQGLVHRDVKPANILLDQAGQIRLTDFGLALHGHDLPEHCGDGSGTLPYMAPEQLRNATQQVDPRTDIWAAGVVIYEMLTGRLPFQAGSRRELSDAILNAEPAPLRTVQRNVPGGLERICLKCLHKDTDGRYSSAADLAADLRTWRRAASRPFLSRTAGVMALSVAAGLLALAALVFPSLFGRSTDSNVPSPPPAKRNSGGEGWVRGGKFLSADRLSTNPNENGPDWDPRVALRQPREPVAWMNDCKLIFIAETGACVDLPAAQQYVRGYCSSLLPREPLTFHPSRAAEVGESLQTRDGWLCWEMPLSIVWIEKENDSHLGPLDYGVRLRLAVSADGCFQLGTIGGRPDEHLLVLAQRGGIRNYCHFGGSMLQADAFEVPHDFHLDLDKRQNKLAAWFASIYERFLDRGLVTGGPPREADLYLCPVRLHNRFDHPITVVHARIHHQQFDYEWYPEDFRKVEEAMNARWSPIAERTDEEADLAFSFEMKSDPTQPSALFVRAASDNHNATAFRIDGLSNVGSPPHEFQGKSSSITLDREAGVCRGGNEGSCSAYAILFGQSPPKVELTAHTSWSVVQPAFRYATLGRVEITHTESMPAGSALQNIEPQIWQIPPDDSANRTIDSKLSSSDSERQTTCDATS